MSQPQAPSPELARAVVRVGDGRGFVVEAADSGRLVITGSHCLPNLPPCASAAYFDERTYPDLIGKLGEEPTVWAECLFVDPVSDIAVLGSPDTQDLRRHADAYKALVDGTLPLQIGSLKLRPQTVGPPNAESGACLLYTSDAADE